MSRTRNPAPGAVSSPGCSTVRAPAQRAARNTRRDHKPEDIDCSGEHESATVCLPSCKIRVSLGYSLQTSVELRDKLILEAIVHN